MGINVAIITYDKYPRGDAGAIRCESLAEMLIEIGYSPFVIGMGRHSELHSNIPYVSVYNDDKGYNNYLKYHKNIEMHLKPLNLKYIIMVNPPILTWFWLKKYCRNKKIILIHDSVEWYSKEQFKHGRLSYLYLEKSFENRFLVKNMKVIAISKYLYDYYTSKGLPCIRIPVILNKTDFQVTKKTDSKVFFMYAGSPGRKDCLDVMMRAFALWKKKDLNEIEIHLYGVTNEQLETLLMESDYKKLIPYIRCFGRVDRTKVLKALSSAHYTMLYRNSGLRYARAGFPTKVIESLMCGVPVIANISSDLGDYLEDEKNSIICKEDTVTAFSAALFKAYKVHKDGLYEDLSLNARKLAVENFDYRIYEDLLQRFMKERV